VDALIERVAPLEEGPQIVEALAKGESDLIKVILERSRLHSVLTMESALLLFAPPRSIPPGMVRKTMKISAFPKCYLDEISVDRSMSVFDWIEMAKQLGAEGLEMYTGFFTSWDDATSTVWPKRSRRGLCHAHVVLLARLYQPRPDFRKREIEREAGMIRVTRRLGGPGAVCASSAPALPRCRREEA